MPDAFRVPMRMDCAGIDLTHPIDRMPPGSFPYLFNCRVVEEGSLDGRPGYTKQTDLAGPPNSIRRLNDPTGIYAPQNYIYVGGVGTDLYAGVANNYTLVDSGYSGHPLSLVIFRPDQSPESWMYIYDSLKQEKLRPDKTPLPIGVPPPIVAPPIEYGIPADVAISTGQSAAGWAATGVSATPTLQDRTNGSAPTVGAILYNSGTTGWCCINVPSAAPFWMGDRMKVTLSGGGGEDVVVREIHKSINTTTLQAILYDSGASGPCSLTLVGSPIDLDRNSLIQVGGEIVRVLEVNLAVDGINYSVRCSTTAPHAAGEAVSGLLSWYVYTTLNHVVGETIASSYVQVSHSGAGVGTLQLAAGLDASTANSRPVDIANDFLHISLFMQNPQNVTNIQLLLSLDPTPNFSFSNPGNSIIWTLTHDELQVGGSSGNSWADLFHTALSEGVRYGSDLTRTIANISGIAIQMTSTAACAYGFDWWYLFGTYGQVIQPNSPVGTVYQYRNRDFRTGAHSVPGPMTRYQLFPLREAVVITPAYSPLPEVTEFDLYRQGGSVVTPLYVATVQNNNPPFSYTDGLPDDVVLTANQPPDLAALQPWPILQSPKSGQATVVGTSVFLNSGASFDLNLLGNTTIMINDVAYLTYGTPRSPTFLELQKDAGYIADAYIEIDSPTYANQPLPYAFGPLEGPFAPVVFALGDPLNGGLLYFTNFNDADSASDANTVELAPPSNSLVSGQVWNGLCFAGNTDDVFCIRYTYLQAIVSGGGNNYQWAKVPSPSGFWSRWSSCSTPLGVAFLGRDGIYIATENGALNITDEKLYPLFPHEGEAAEPITIGTDVILPVDMTNHDALRMSYCTEEIRFSYKDTAGNFNTLVYELNKKRWMPYHFADNITVHYMDELPAENTSAQRITMLSVGVNKMLLAGGDTDDGAVINTLVVLPSMDGGDQRAQKLYVDSMFQMSTTVPVSYVPLYENAQSTDPSTPLLTIAPLSGIQQYLQTMAVQPTLRLHRNVSAKFAWTGGPHGARLFAWECSGYMQPYLCTSIVTQQFPFSFPGWKHMRRLLPAYISTTDLLFTIICQDGRVFGPYTLAASFKYRIIPVMLDRNIKDLAFSLSIKSSVVGGQFAIFQQDFTAEVKEWNESSYIKLAIFRA